LDSIGGKQMKIIITFMGFGAFALIIMGMIQQSFGLVIAGIGIRILGWMTSAIIEKNQKEN
jgi:hypothetical protein